MKLPSFEDPLDGVTPPGWTRNEAPLDSYPEARVLDEFASDGDFSLKMDGELAFTMQDGERKGRSIMLRSTQMPARPGWVYSGSVDIYTEVKNGPNPQIFLEFWDADGKRFSTPLTNTASSGRVGEWETVTHVETAPEGAVGVTVWFYANTNYEGVTYWDNAKLHASRHAD